jgi:hypothetical protein
MIEAKHSVWSVAQKLSIAALSQKLPLQAMEALAL